MRTTTRIFCATAVAAGLLVSAIPASSAVPLPLGGGRMIAASLRLSDVPPSFFQMKPTIELDYRVAPATRRFEMCVDKDGHKVFGAPSLQHATASVPLYQAGPPTLPTDAIAVASHIYGYASVNAATIRWRQLVAATSRCAPIIHKPISISGVDVLADVRQQIGPLGAPCTRGDVGTVCGFSIAQQVVTLVGTGPGDVRIYVGGYSVFRKVGTTIVRMTFVNYTQTSAKRSKIRAVWSAFTRVEAARIAARVSRIPVT